MSSFLEFERLNFLQMEKTDGHLRSDSWLRFLLSQDFSEDFLEQESRPNGESMDFLSFLKKQKADILDLLPREDKEDGKVWPIIKKDLGACALPILEKSSKSQIVQEQKVNVHFLGLKKEYEKVQSRVNRQSRQRLTGSKVRIVVTTDAQIADVMVYVERAPMAAALCGDSTGRVPLKVKMGTQVVNKHHLSVDLDSVYMSPQGTPVYKLSTVDAERRNRFRLTVSTFFVDGKGSKTFVSPAFLLRSRRPERKKSF